MIFIIYRSLNYFLNFLKGRNWAHMNTEIYLNLFNFLPAYKKRPFFSLLHYYKDF
jgi:hypothetical protein